jgi:predicted transcriptional regulator
MPSLEDLRLERFQLRVTKRELARELGCDESWLNQLELHGYNGPAALRWRQRYKEALNTIVQRKATQ